jgi:hypothetical protein
VAGSGESLFLWDLSVGRMVHEAMPPRRSGGSSSSSSAEGGGGPSGGNGSLGGSAGTHAGPDTAGDGSDDVGGQAAVTKEEGFPPYVFALAAQPARAGGTTGLLATACCDGAVRLWRLGASHLLFAGEIEVSRVPAAWLQTTCLESHTAACQA